VEHKETSEKAFGLDESPGRGSAHCWVLRRHLLVGCSFLAAPGLDRLTHPMTWVLARVVGCGGGCGWVGVWWCVECCIVDASILFCVVFVVK
jgi:hypothetical protein